MDGSCMSGSLARLNAICLSAETIRHAVIRVRIQVAPDVMRSHTEIARTGNLDNTLCRNRLPLGNALVRDPETTCKLGF